MQTFPPVPTTVAPTINNYVENKILAPTFKRRTTGSDIDKVKFVCSASDSFLLYVNKRRSQSVKIVGFVILM